MWKGYVVHAWSYRGELRLAGRLADGSSFAALVHRPSRYLFRPDQDGAWKSFEGEGLSSIDEAEAQDMRTGPGVFDSGFPPAEEFLLFRGIRGTVTIRGDWIAGRRVDRVFTDPEISPSDHLPSVVWASLDVETDPDGAVTAIALVSEERGLVFFRDASRVPWPVEEIPVQCYPSERALLEAFAHTIRTWDPDIITGWNVADFDFTVLARRFQANAMTFDIGRAEDEPARVRTTLSGMTRVVVSGRQVVDAMRVVRASGRTFPDLRLDTVAREVLGRSKTVSDVGRAKVEELERLRRDDPAAFCRYNLEDARLVPAILRETGLDGLTLIRANLTGMSFDMAWTSIPAFERIYAMELIRRRILPPRRERRGEVSGAAGGTVLDAIPGLFHNVLVFDFRSLYPTVMRTFNIDPLAFERARSLAAGSGREERSFITAPNGACFLRDTGILPQLLDAYFRAREDALEAGDAIAAFVYKILMNSFYGVLGSAGCIYGRTELAGAITGFGRYCLLFARDFFQEQGMTVLYGDTDSVFVYAHGTDISHRGDDLAEQLNAALSETIHREWDVESSIGIRCETVYRRFLLPRLRTATDDTGIRGRAKGYAGLVESGGPEPTVEIKGMEAARSDYTPLARRFQRELLRLVFLDRDDEEIETYVRRTMADLFRGHLDGELVYSKILRRPARDYRHTTPPQVRAARKLGWTTERGRIDYVMTTAGPEPESARGSAPIDYRHYVDHQLRPIWTSIAEAVDLGDSLADATARGERGRLVDLRPLDDQLGLGLH